MKEAEAAAAPAGAFEAQVQKSVEAKSSAQASLEGTEVFVDAPSAPPLDLTTTPFGLCWLHPPKHAWSPAHYTATDGVEQLQMYLWLAKDLSWMRLAFWPGMILGATTCFVQLCVVCRAAYLRNAHEFAVQLGQAMWLGANYWWMIGELHDHKFEQVEPQDGQWYSRHDSQAGWLLDSCLILMGVYTLFLRPFNILPVPSPAARKPYERMAFQPRRAVRWALRLNGEESDWRVYENCHLFFWCGKDSAWCHFNTGSTPTRRAVMWIMFMIPTVAISLDFNAMSIFRADCLVEHAHFAAGFFWVMANVSWAAGELWGDAYHDVAVGLVRGRIPPPLDASSEITSTDESMQTYLRYVLRSGRWWGAWICILAYVPIVSLFAVWWSSSFLRWRRRRREEAAAACEMHKPLLGAAAAAAEDHT